MSKIIFQQGDIHWVEFPIPAKKSHILQDKHPAVIISNNQQNQFSTVLTVLPITSQLDKVYPFEVLTNINDKKSKILLDQITTIDKEFVSQKITSLSDKELVEIEKKLHLTLAFSCYQK